MLNLLLAVVSKTLLLKRILMRTRQKLSSRCFKATRMAAGLSVSLHNIVCILQEEDIADDLIKSNFMTQKSCLGVNTKKTYNTWRVGIY